MRKSPKAEKVQALLAKGMTTKKIIDKLKVSPSYVWVVKKKLAEQQTDDNEVRPRVVAPHKVMRVTKKQADALKEEARAAANSVSDPTNVNGILNERHNSYGSFRDMAALAQRLKGVAHNFAHEHGRHYAPDQAEALDMIFSKIARIVNGDANKLDSWVDIAGYAQLVADRLQGKVR